MSHVSSDSLEDTIPIDELIQCARNLQQPADIPQPVASFGRYMVRAITPEKIGSACAAEEVLEKTNSESFDASGSSSQAMKDNKQVRFASEQGGKGGGIVDGVSAHTPSDSSRAGEANALAATPGEESKRAHSPCERRRTSDGNVEISATTASDSSRTEEEETFAAVPEEVASAAKQASGVCYSLAQMTDSKVWRALPNVNPTEREKLLSPRDFQEVFEMSREEFEKLPRWKRDVMKQRRALF